MSDSPQPANRSAGPGGAGDPLAALARTEGIPSAMAAARDAADAVLRDRGMRKVPPELTAQALLTGARASARLETRAEQSDAGAEPTSESESRWLAGAVRMSTELIGLAPSVRREPGRVLARLHTLAARDVVEEADLGRVRPEAAGRMADLQQLLASRTEAPALVLAAIAHAEIAATQPFGTGSGMVARAAERLVQIGSGIDPAAVIIPEAGHLASGSAYPQALNAYARQGLPGVRRWLLHAADAFAYGVEVSPVSALPRRR